MRPFRRGFIRRRLTTTGGYESEWQDISEYVINWGKLHSSVDEVKLNEFKHSGITLICRNDKGTFNPEYNGNSLWNGYMTRYRTLLKIEAGYYRNAEAYGEELPSDPIIGIFILTDDVIIDGDKNRATLKFRSLVSVFDEVKAKDVAGLGGTQTASQLIAKLRDHTDGSANYVFQQFISSGAWDITSGSTKYNLATTTTIGDKTCWELMQEVAEAEGNILLINRTGGFEFRGREARTTTSQFTFNGQGFKDTNVIRLAQYREPFSKYFNYIRLKFKESDTETSYAHAGTKTTVDPTTDEWKYGVRTMEFENDFLSTTVAAESVVNALKEEFGNMAEEVKIVAKFCPQLEVGDRVTFNYRSYSLNEPDAYYYDQCDYAGTTNLVAHWKMDDDAANNEVREEEGLHNGVCDTITSALSVNGKINTALNFTGSTHVTVANTSTVNFGYSNFAIAFWEKRDTKTSVAIVSKDTYNGESPAGESLWEIETAFPYSYQFWYNNTNAASAIRHTDKSWHFVVFVRRGNNAEWWVDGVADATSSNFFASTTSFNNDQDLLLGGRASDGFRGSLDNVMLFRAAPSGSDIAYMWNNGIGREDEYNDSDDIGYYDTEEGENFDWDSINFKILSRHHDLMKFTSEFLLRRL